MFRVGDRILSRGRPGEIVRVDTSYSSYYLLECGVYGASLNHLIEMDTNMARPRKSPEEKKATAKKNEVSSLLEAAKFCAPGYKADGESYSQHAMIYQKWFTTYDGVIMYGHPVNEDIACLPHFGMLQHVLKSCDEGLSVTLPDLSRMTIKSGKFRATVPCLSDPTLVHRNAPDPAISVLDNRMREGFELMKQVARKTGERVIDASVLVRNGDMIATDRKMIVNYWHGIGFPTLTVPANFIEAILRVPKALTSFGYTDGQSLTFYFEDGSFIRTQLYDEKWPDNIDSVLPPPDCNGYVPVPPTLFAALEKVEPFAINQCVFFGDGMIETHDTDDIGAKADVEGLREAGDGIDVVRLLRLKDRITHFDYFTDNERCFFVGTNLRGALVMFTDADSRSDETVAQNYQSGPMVEGAQNAVDQVSSGGFTAPSA